jgi:Domain of unknown function (DUF1735)/F5/8 type C domain
MNKHIQLFCLLGLILLGSCKKNNSLDSKDLLVYMQGDFGSASNTITASLTQTPIAVWGNTSFVVQAWSTRQMVSATEVYLAPDSQQVAQYNLVNKKNCLLMPAGTYTIDASDHVIAADSIQSDPFTVTITNPAALTDTNGYVLPLTINKVTGNDKGVGISSNRATAYLYVPYAFTNLDTVQTPLSGTLLARTAWKVTVSNTTSGALGPAMLDGSNTTAWRSSNSSTAAKYVILNMGSQQSVAGFQLIPDYVTTTENPTQIRVSTSPDSTTWTVQGIWKGTGPATGSSAVSPDIKGINFLAPVQAKFFRFDIMAWVSGSRTGIGELNAVQ